MAKECYLLTRPRLYDHLIINGINCRAVPNPFDPGFQAWIIDLTPKAAALIANWYTAEQLKTPAKITKYLLSKEQEQGNV